MGFADFTFAVTGWHRHLRERYGRRDVHRVRGGIGFSLRRSHDNLLRGNESLRNDDEGFKLALNSRGNELRQNRSDRNGGTGFAVQQSDDNRLTENQALANDGNGFSLHLGASGNTLRRNIACQNIVDAIDDGSGVGNVWAANDFCTSAV